jgi:tRNA (guanine37-N1)-methyltransferase
MLEAIVRLKENVLGNKDSLLEESHSGSGFLEYPIYTRPPVWRGIEVPSVLLSGNHKLIAEHRLEQSIKKTCETRPDIIEKLDLTGLSVRERELVEKYRAQ